MGTSDSKPSHGAWKRGIITAVSEGLSARWVEECTWKNGQFHAIEVGGVLCINSYVKPGEDSITFHLSELEAFMTRTRWEGRWLCGGDWNEEWLGSWIATFAGLHGGEQQDCAAVSSSRWNSSLLIDYWFSNFSIGSASRRMEKLSDHCIITTTVDFGKLLDESYTRFVQEKQLKCPDWLSVGQWHMLFKEAYLLGEKLNWQEAILQVEEMNWPSEVGEQELIDYQWALVCAKLSWSFATASGYALHQIPLGYDNLKEIHAVVEVANFRKAKGVSIRIQKRALQKKAARTSLAIRKLYKKAGRLTTLTRAFLRNRVDSEVINLQKKLFPNLTWNELSRSMVKDKLDSVQQCITTREAEEKDNNINSWKRRMHSGIHERGKWIHKQGQQKSPNVADDKNASNRQEGAQMLHRYWRRLWDNQNWTEEEREAKAGRIADAIRNQVSDQIEGSRPALSEFQAGLKRIAGTHGIDGWAACELKAIAAVNEAAQMVWDAMELWEETSLVPECIAHCKLVCVAKKDKRILCPHEYRPICVMSSLWRAWSSTWIRTSCIAEWRGSLFPATVSGGIPGSHGPETLAAVIDHQVHCLHHGVSLDFKHAFDTVDLRLMHQALRQSVPNCMKPWLDLVIRQWVSMSRWIVFDGCVNQQSIQTATGLPQGDPASPMIMNVLMWFCMQEVNRVCDDSTLFHVTYMDDRTVVASSSQTIQKAEDEWNRLACEFHLLENKDKAQHVNVQHFETMDVLGALVGRPLPSDDKISKASQRIDASATRYRRIHFLPLKHRQKLFTANVFARSGLEYGWIASCPTEQQLKAQEIWLWKCLGRTSYSSPYMRSVIVGANSHMRFMLFKKQISLLAKRDLELRNLELPVSRTFLNQMVEDGLSKLGWECTDQFWTHHDFELGFRVDDLNDELLWRKVSHNIRESFRKHLFDGLVQCGRHDANEINVPYDCSRRKLALRWAGDDFTSFMLIVGGMASPYQRQLIGFGSENSHCSICGESAPGWEHIWLCANGFIPADGLLIKRFLWPRTSQDFPLCSSFRKVFAASCCWWSCTWRRGCAALRFCPQQKGYLMRMKKVMKVMVIVMGMVLVMMVMVMMVMMVMMKK